MNHKAVATAATHRAARRASSGSVDAWASGESATSAISDSESESGPELGRNGGAVES